MHMIVLCYDHEKERAMYTPITTHGPPKQPRLRYPFRFGQYSGMSSTDSEERVVAAINGAIITPIPRKEFKWT